MPEAYAGRLFAQPEKSALVIYIQAYKACLDLKDNGRRPPSAPCSGGALPPDNSRHSGLKSTFLPKPMREISSTVQLIYTSGPVKYNDRNIDEQRERLSGI